MDAINRATHGKSMEQRRLMVDRIRDALDRGEARIADEPAAFLADSFTLETLIAAGCHSLVYRARQRDLGSMHAVKMVADHSRDDPIARDMLFREARIGMAVSHSHLLPIQTLLRMPDGRPALVMPWFKISLGDFLKSEAVSLDMIEQIILNVLSGLSAIHAAGYVHGDIAPGNLLMADGDPATLRIADFGIALEIGQNHLELDIAFAGNAEFASPEQKMGQALHPQSDLYAVGRLASRMAGLLSHQGDEKEKYRLTRLKAFAGCLSHERPENRPATAEAAMGLLID